MSSNQNPKVSVIIPVYNVQPYLRKCLNSVVSQTLKEIEIILIDDGSTDDSGKICDEYALADERILVVHQGNAGHSAARNRGLDIARGTYIGFVDSDDYIETDMFEYLYNLAVEQNADISQCGQKQVYQDRTLRVPDYDYFEITDSVTYFRRLLEAKHSSMNVFTKLFHRNLIGTIRFKDYKIGEDVMFVSETAVRVKRAVLTCMPKYNYVHRSGSLTNSEFSPSMYDYIDVYDKVYQIAVNHSDSLEKAARMRTCYARLEVLDHMYLSTGKYDKNKEDEICRYLKGHKDIILYHNYVTMGRKLAFVALLVNRNLYRAIVRHFYLSYRPTITGNENQ